MEERICQSCAMPLNNDEENGTNKDGSKTNEYCVYFFKDGEFVEELTLEEAIVKSADYAELAGMTKDQAIEYAGNVFPTLNRWKQAI